RIDGGGRSSLESDGLVAVNPDSSRALTTVRNQGRLWEVSTGRVIARIGRPDCAIDCLAMAPDGRRLATGLSFPASAIVIGDGETGRDILSLLGHRNGVTSVAFSPDGRTLASGSIDQTARLWDARDGRCLAVLRGHRAVVASTLFTPDGRLLITHS